MKIMHICQFLGVGGLEKVLYSLIHEQVKEGHEVEVIVYDHDRRWVEKFEKELNIKIHTDYLKKAGYDFSLLFYLKKKIENQDIIHTHDLNPMLYIGILKFFHPGLKIIHTTHGMEHLQTHPKTRLYEVFLGFVSDCIIAVSPKFKEYYQSQFFTKKNKVHLINNGTMISKTTSQKDDKIKEQICQEFNLNINLPLAIYIARVVPLKGQKELMISYKQLDHQLLIVGPSGNDDYYKDCAALTDQKICMTGQRDDVSRLLKGSDYFVSASHHEGLPIAILEAGAQGLPCLLSNISGHRLFNKQTESVLLFYDYDKDIAQKSQLILERGKELSQNFLKLIHEEYSAKAMARKYLSFYKDCLKC